MTSLWLSRISAFAVQNHYFVKQGTAEEQLVRLTAQERAGKAQPSAPSGGDPSSPEKAQAEAKERSRRNHMLRAMRRISEALLPAFQDLPVAQ